MSSDLQQNVEVQEVLNNLVGAWFKFSMPLHFQQSTSNMDPKNMLTCEESIYISQ